MTKKSLLFVLFLVISAAESAFSQTTPQRFYQIPSLKYVDALSGKKITNADLKGQMTVVSFVFTSCQYVCPFIMGNMANLQKKYADTNDVKLMSVTTDPRKDNGTIFKKYADKFSAKSGKWWFITGKPEEIVTFVKDGFKLPISLESPNVHSEKIALLDENGWIRGYFNSSDKNELTQLDEAINQLRQEIKTEPKEQIRKTGKS